ALGRGGDGHGQRAAHDAGTRRGVASIGSRDPPCGRRAGVSGRHLERLHEAAKASPGGPVTAALDRMRRDPLLAFASAAGPFSIVLLLFLMTDKPSGATAALAGAIFS